MQRKLAAILAADVVGYSRLMRADEVGTLAAMKALWSEVVQPSVRSHRGRVFKLMGDGMLAEFASVVDAANAAEAIQTAANERAGGQAEDNAIRLRIGINLGDVVVDGSDLYGDGVNIAARLQEVAEPGGIAVSATTQEYLRGKGGIVFADGGEKSLKNIDDPVQVWLWPSTAPVGHDHVPAPSVQNASQAKSNRSSQPSIAVLPFQNLSSDPDAEFFADGMTEDVINALSKFRWLFVIARGTMFTYKGRAVGAAETANDLGVRFVLEGSVRQAVEQIRVSAHLTDCTTGNTIWSERFGRPRDDLFQIQDEITAAISAAIAPEMDRAERTRGERASSNEIDAWLLYQQAVAQLEYNPEQSLAAAIELCQQVQTLDRRFALAYAVSAEARALLAQNHQPENYDADLKAAFADVSTALTLDARDHRVLATASRVHYGLGQTHEAITYAQAAIQVNPNSPSGYHALAIAYGIGGQAELALDAAARALAISPFDPLVKRIHFIRSGSLLLLGRYAEAAEAVQFASSLGSISIWGYGVLAISYHRLNQPEHRERALAALYEQKPDFSIAFVKHGLRRASSAWVDPFLEGLRELDVPEE